MKTILLLEIGLQEYRMVCSQVQNGLHSLEWSGSPAKASFENLASTVKSGMS